MQADNLQVLAVAHSAKCKHSIKYQDLCWVLREAVLNSKKEAHIMDSYPSRERKRLVE